ncbi:MAG TPA: cation:proton antiporter [Lacipirellulaceae bacterium]|nr:cation:proton antiporter [Lacipirellulaceae bacterium]
MHGAHEFLETLALVLCVAAVTTVLFQRLKQPVVLGYLLAGMLVGTHVPVPFEAQGDVIRNLAELGVTLLMFLLGVEFSLGKLIQVGPVIGFVGLVECSFMIWLGYSAGQAFGWPRLTSFFAGAMLASASTTIIVKAYNEQHIKADFTRIVFGVLLLDDLIAIILIVILTALSEGEGLTALELLRTAGRLALFLTVMLIVGLLLVPRLMRAIVRLNRTETTVVASVGLAFAFAMVAAASGYSVALGAFIAGSLVAESGVEQQVQRVVEPVRDIFAAIFFVSVGMLIDPAQVAAHWPTVLIFVALVVVGRISAVTVGTFLTGQSVQTSLKVAMSMAQIGEFSFIIVGVGLASGATDQLLYSIAVAVSGITTLLTPWLIRAAEPAAAWVDRKLPRSLQTFAALYASWLEQLRTRSEPDEPDRLRPAVRWLALDTVVVAAIIIGASIEMERIVEFAQDRFNVARHTTRAAVVVGATLLTAPFWFGMVRVARYLGFELATRVFPATDRAQLDLAAAPRRLLIVTLQLAIVLLVGLPLIAITQPFLPPFRGAAVLLLVLLLLAAAFWRGATNLQGHARAGAQALAAALARQTRAGRKAGAAHAMEDANRILAGLGSPVAVEIRPNNPHVGQSLADIKLRGLTGATVLAIQRGETSVAVPSGSERLQPGDILAVAGTHEAVEAAKKLLATKE